MTKLTGLIMSAALAFGSLTHADWIVHPDSVVTFETTKNTHNTETHRFTAVDGYVSEAGLVDISIPLISIDSGIDIRDQRMRLVLFQIEQFPTAKLSATILDDTLFAELAKGKLQTVTLDGNLELHGQLLPVSLSVMAVPMADGTLVVSSTEPLLIDARRVGLSAGVEVLRQVAGLDRIGYTVPVSFVLVLKPEHKAISKEMSTEIFLSPRSVDQGPIQTNRPRPTDELPAN